MDSWRAPRYSRPPRGRRRVEHRPVCVSREDVNLILAELADQPQAVLYAPLLEALLSAAASLDTDASRLDTGHEQTTKLPLAQEHAPRFRRWLQDAALRARVAGHEEKARALVRIRRSEG
jgi:hypothetical protein